MTNARHLTKMNAEDPVKFISTEAKISATEAHQVLDAYHGDTRLAFTALIFRDLHRAVKNTAWMQN